jgi:signal transduction histidine kinase
LLVEDSDRGIPEKNSSKIFDSSFRAKPFGEGTGLGLSIEHDMVGQFRASIGVASEAGNEGFPHSYPLRKVDE